MKAVDKASVAEVEEPVPGTCSLEVPVRMLQVVGVAAKENTRYAMDGVLIDADRAKGLICAVATDGRRLVVAEWNTRLFDTPLSVLVPGDVARNAVKLAKQYEAGDEEPMAVVSRDGDEYAVTVRTDAGEAILNWQKMELPFPPYRECIPDWADSTGVASIGITPSLVAGTLTTLQKIVGEEPLVRVYLPSKPDKPLGFESQDGGKLKALGVVMPANIEGWIEKPQQIKGEKKPPKEEAAPLPFAASGDSTPIGALDLPDPTAAKLRRHGLDTVAKILKAAGDDESLASLIDHDSGGGVDDRIGPREVTAIRKALKAAPVAVA
jgi:hypothetical protein